MHQRKYALELILEAGLAAAKPEINPTDVNIKLTSKQYDDYIDEAECSEEEDRLVDQTSYQRLRGKQLYLTVTRPDIAFGVQTLSQFLQQPKISHMEAALRIVKKSVIGFLVKVSDSLVSWKSKKQTTISRSSAEAEYRSLATTVAELIWLYGLLTEVDTKIQLPINIYSDSKAAIQIAANPIYHERTKHIEIDCHFVQLSSNDVVGCAGTFHRGFEDLGWKYLLSGVGKLQVSDLGSAVAEGISRTAMVLCGRDRISRTAVRLCGRSEFYADRGS
ncbi:PREDICTED: uncharacterized protein LOC109237415 [Nicotiana attenuata]|uniref:uncharacterized protein LOC109237415 n=1 Tax=Nicotiana attenuata TaxID=49451 RepID=UPI00090513BA|nr:PREDICTED: uncharacterized protein LOC109237415 [Nicotiana attenuata]